MQSFTEGPCRGGEGLPAETTRGFGVGLTPGSRCPRSGASPPPARPALPPSQSFSFLHSLSFTTGGINPPFSLCPSAGAFPPVAPLCSLPCLPRDSAFSEIKSFFGSAATLYKSDIVCMTVCCTQILTNSFFSSGGFSHAWCGAGGDSSR